jgi:hypothetical protein
MLTKADSDGAIAHFLAFLAKADNWFASFGLRSKSGEPSKHEVLGEYGAWDRYDDKYHSLHIEYAPHIDKIKMVTLMRSDAVP